MDLFLGIDSDNSSRSLIQRHSDSATILAFGPQYIHTPFTSRVTLYQCPQYIASNLPPFFIRSLSQGAFLNSVPSHLLASSERYAVHSNRRKQHLPLTKAFINDSQARGCGLVRRGDHYAYLKGTSLGLGSSKLSCKSNAALLQMIKSKVLTGPPTLSILDLLQADPMVALCKRPDSACPSRLVLVPGGRYTALPTEHSLVIFSKSQGRCEVINLGKGVNKFTSAIKRLRDWGCDQALRILERIVTSSQSTCPRDTRKRLLNELISLYRGN